MEYKILNKGEWKTNMFVCDSESCFLSCIVPCHVYAKIISTSKSLYCINLIIYCIIYLSIHQLWYSQNYIIENTCSKELTDNCISIKDNCENFYMIIDNIPFSCIYTENFCISNNKSCINHEDSNNSSLTIFLLSSSCYFILVFMNYKAREHIKNIYQKETNCVEDITAVTCCSTCGLAQEYREL